MWGETQESPELFPCNYPPVRLFNYLNPYSNNLGVESLQVAAAMGLTQRDIGKTLTVCVKIWRKLNGSK